MHRTHNGNCLLVLCFCIDEGGKSVIGLAEGYFVNKLIYMQIGAKNGRFVCGKHICHSGLYDDLIVARIGVMIG